MTRRCGPPSCNATRRRFSASKHGMNSWRRLTLLAAALIVLGIFVPCEVAQTAQIPATGPDNCTLRIHVDGLRNSKGVVGSVVFSSPRGWPEDISKAYRTGPTPIAAGAREVTAVWTGLPAGDYAVAAIHDENKNAHLDRNFFGIPREGFGFANNPRVTLSAPSFKAAIVHVNCPVTDTSIHLQYR